MSDQAMRRHEKEGVFQFDSIFARSDSDTVNITLGRTTIFTQGHSRRSALDCCRKYGKDRLCCLVALTSRCELEWREPEPRTVDWTDFTRSADSSTHCQWWPNMAENLYTNANLLDRQP